MMNIGILPLEKVKKGVMVEEIDFQSHAPFKSSFFTIKPGAESPVDSHKVKETWIVEGGIGTLTCDDTKIILKKGSVVLFESFNTHSVKNNGNTDLSIVSIWWDAIDD